MEKNERIHAEDLFHLLSFIQIELIHVDKITRKQKNANTGKIESGMQHNGRY